MIEVVGSSKIMVPRYQYKRHHSVGGLVPGEVPAGTLVQNKVV